MNSLILFSLSLFAVTACKERPIVQDLGNGFTISGMQSKGIYTIKKGGMQAARIDLHEEYLAYSSYKLGPTMTGHVSSPLTDSSGRGCSALISFVNSAGKLESHQVVERRILTDKPSKEAVVIGGVVYLSDQAEQQGASGQRR